MRDTRRSRQCLGVVGLCLLATMDMSLAHTDAAHEGRPNATSRATMSVPELRSELARLHAENERLREQNRVRDVFAGLGIIGGMFAAGYFIAARRKRHFAQ